jgi:putative ABC transport system permease protein
MSASHVLRWEDRNVATTLTGTTMEGLRIRNIQAAAGRIFDDADDAGMLRVTVLGSTVARNLFAGVDPVGHLIRIGNAWFEVIGVARPRGVDPLGADLDDMAVIPFGTAARRVFNISYVHAVFVQATSSVDLVDLENDVREILRDRHPVRSGMTEPFTIQNQAALLRTERAAAQAMNELVVGVAVLALLLGGIGILAVTLIAVRERIQEIGLRRALGARRQDILVQFLSEAMILAGAGGAAGVFAGIIVALAVPFFGLGETMISWPPAAAGLFISILLGVVCGTYPAIRAARMNPIDALRPK